MYIVFNNLEYNFYIKDAEDYSIFIKRFSFLGGLNKKKCFEIWFYNNFAGNSAYAYPLVNGKIYWEAHSNISFPEEFKSYCDRLLKLLIYV